MTEADARSWFRDTLGADAIAMDRLDTLATLLREENGKQNLISKSSEERLWVRHFVDSAQLLRVPRGTFSLGTWLDLGTGAGFPGLVIAICRPEIKVQMVDSRRLRVEWLQSVTETLGLTNACPTLSRVELLPDATYETISARAFAPLATLVEITARFSTPETFWLLPKGAKAAQELAMLGGCWSHMFHVEQSITDPGAGIIAGRLVESPSTKPIRSASKRLPR